MGLYKAFEAEGINYEQTAVGDKYVAENMLENNYSIGGEQSGHVIFSRYAATGDGILTSLMIMEACVEQKATLCDLAKRNEGLSADSPQRSCCRQDCKRNPKVVEAVEAAKSTQHRWTYSCKRKWYRAADSCHGRGRNRGNLCRTRK